MNAKIDTFGYRGLAKIIPEVTKNVKFQIE